MFLYRLERSTDQVIKPINLEALSKWVGHIPDDVVNDMYKIAPMLKKLGYDPFANPPNYGEPDPLVKEKMDELDKNKQHWDNVQKQVVQLRNEIRQHIINKSTVLHKSIDEQPHSNEGSQSLNSR